MKTRRFGPRFDTLEPINLMAGSVVQSGLAVFVMPDATAATNTTVLSYQSVGDTQVVDVQINGEDHYFAPSSIIHVIYFGMFAGGNQTFVNQTAIDTNAWGGSGSNHFVAGSRTDVFVGGGGVNVFDAGPGFTQMMGGAGDNTYNLHPTGGGEIFRQGRSNTINRPAGATGNYIVY